MIRIVCFVPCPKTKHESHPREEEYSSVRINDVKNRYASSFLGDGIDLRGLPQQ